eukprot:6139315-Prymnesium_polylepis.1
MSSTSSDIDLACTTHIEPASADESANVTGRTVPSRRSGVPARAARSYVACTACHAWRRGR